MSDKKKPSRIEERRRHGGGFDVLARADLEKAKTDTSHILHHLILAIQSGAQEQFMRLLAKVIADPQSSSSPGLVMLKVLLAQEAIKFAEDNINDHDASAGLPLEITKWACIGVGLRESKAAGGRKKSAGWRVKVIEAWNASDKKLSPSSFAENLFKKLGGSYDENGKKKGNVPSPRTIAGWIRNHKKK